MHMVKTMAHMLCDDLRKRQFCVSKQKMVISYHDTIIFDDDAIAAKVCPFIAAKIKRNYQCKQMCPAITVAHIVIPTLRLGDLVARAHTNATWRIQHHLWGASIDALAVQIVMAVA